jgi:hypothetical protein
MVYISSVDVVYKCPHLFFFTGLSFFFLIGVAAPALTWLISRKWPNTWLRYVNWPVIFSGIGLIPPASAVNYVPWAIVGFIFQYVIRRRHFSWWTKYNYVLSAAMDSGVAISIVVIFFWYGFLTLATLGTYRLHPLVCNILEMALLGLPILLYGGVSRCSFFDKRYGRLIGLFR